MAAEAIQSRTHYIVKRNIPGALPNHNGIGLIGGSPRMHSSSTAALSPPWRLVQGRLRIQRITASL